MEEGKKHKTYGVIVYVLGGKLLAYQMIWDHVTWICQSDNLT